MQSGSDDERTVQLWRELVENSVECELCNEPYDDDADHIPRLLSCGHTFCQSCLEDWSAVGSHTELGDGSNDVSDPMAVMDCPTCRRTTTYNGREGAKSLPKNFELLRVRQEIGTHTEAQMRRLKEVWLMQVLEKEQLAKEAEDHARQAQRESVQASQRAMFLVRQVEINEQEKKRAQDMAEEARQRALMASQQAEALQEETELLKKQLQQEALQLAQVQHDASSAAAVAAELHSKAEQLQQQVDRVRAQLSLHAGRHDPTKLVVLVCEPTTVGSWLLPYTRYTVISIASEAWNDLDPYKAAKTWTMMHHVAEPSSSVKVYRRYSDFVWLHRALQRRFPFEFIPCMPGKQVFFNKEREFVGERMRLLQAFLREVLRQPLLASTEEVRSFLLSTTEELENLRKAYADSDDDLLSLDDEFPEDSYVNGSTSQSVPVAASSPPAGASAPAVQSSAWAAWGAVSALTSSAAKFVTNTTGTALNGFSGGLTSKSPTKASYKSSDTWDEQKEDLELSNSLLDDGNGKPPAKSVEMRRKYIDIARAYRSVAQKGSQWSRAERKHSQHMHRLCELMHEMDSFDQSYTKRRRERLATSMDIRDEAARRRLEEEELSFETQNFGARASEAFSAISLATKNHADCMEYALLEAVRMQTLELGAVEDAFSRLGEREEVLVNKVSSTQPSSVSNGGSPSTSLVLTSKQEELLQHRQELNAKVEAMEPLRSQFVLETLQKNTTEMHKLAKAKRKLLEATYKQLVSM